MDGNPRLSGTAWPVSSALAFSGRLIFCVDAVHALRHLTIESDGIDPSLHLRPHSGINNAPSHFQREG